MLVLGRKRFEQIIIGGNITITVTEILGDRVKIGIDAPPETTVHRREVAEKIAREGKRGE